MFFRANPTVVSDSSAIPWRLSIRFFFVFDFFPTGVSLLLDAFFHRQDFRDFVFLIFPTCSVFLFWFSFLIFSLILSTNKEEYIHIQI